ncbi:hypothetical protein SDJN03_23732, partial [Cucurbita argyrosperma subsp. sororia]
MDVWVAESLDRGAARPTGLRLWFDANGYSTRIQIFRLLRSVATRIRLCFLSLLKRFWHLFSPASLSDDRKTICHLGLSLCISLSQLASEAWRMDCCVGRIL